MAFDDCRPLSPLRHPVGRNQIAFAQQQRLLPLDPGVQVGAHQNHIIRRLHRVKQISQHSDKPVKAVQTGEIFQAVQDDDRPSGGQ